MSVHHEPTVHAQRLARHVRGLRRGEEADDIRHVLGCLHAAEGTLLSRALVNSAGLMPSSAPCSRETFSHMSVSTKPGQTQLTRMPSAACASARLLVMLMTAA